MNKYRMLERRINRLEQFIKNESKQIGDLYHVCTLEAYLKYIEPNDQLVASGKYTNWIHGSDQYVSFTRDKYFVVGTKSVQSSKVLVQLVIDGDKLSEHYKIGPYNDMAFDPEGNLVDDMPKYREKEEAVKGPITNLSKYIKEIRVDVFDMDSTALTKIRRSKLADKGAVYFHFIKGFQDKSFIAFKKEHKIKDGTPVAELLNSFKDYVNLNRFNELLFSYDEDDINKAIKGKADLNSKYPAGYVLEEYVTDDGNIDIVSRLIEAGANVNLKMSDGLTAIQIAAERDSPSMVKLLADNGADIDQPDKDGLTPIMIAAKNGCKNTIATLISLGADLNHVSKDGDTAMSLAKTKVIGNMLKKAGAAQ